MASNFGLDREARADAVQRIRAYFERERGEELGELAAGFILDFVAEELGSLFYNAGLADAQALLARHVDSLDADIEAQYRAPAPVSPARARPSPAGRAPADRGIELRTARLLLRPFRAADKADFAEFVSDEAYLRYLSPDHPELEAFMRRNLEAEWDREPGWAIYLADRVVGSAFLGVQANHALGEIAFLVAPAHWGEGIATEAAGAVLAYAFGDRGLAKVVGRADERNLASVRVMEKLGMTREGVLRAHRLDDAGKRSNEVVYGILASEWSAPGRVGAPGSEPPPSSI